MVTFNSISAKGNEILLRKKFGGPNHIKSPNQLHCSILPERFLPRIARKQQNKLPRMY